MLKKGQSISINTIIVAAIALAVLVVIFLIFTGKFKIFNEGVSGTVTCENSCKSLSKTIYRGAGQQCPENMVYVPGTYDDVRGSVCCCQ